jgi:predicted RND superfamily exporter protein
VLETVAAVRHTIESATGNLAISAHYTGTIALNEAYIKVVQDDLLRIVPLLLLVMILVLGILLRSSRAVFTMLPVGICSVAGAFGIAGLFGTELAALNSYTPVIILSISVAGCVHMAMTYARNRNSGLAPQDAAISATRYNLLPMTLANGTTALGFLGLALSPSPPVRLVGYLVATGIVFSFVLCLTLLPVLQARFDPYRPGLADRVAFLDRLAIFATARRTGITILFLLLSLPAAWFASQNVVSDNVLEYFVPGNPFYEDTQLVADKLSGVNEVLYSVETGTEFGLFDADALNAPHSLANWLRLQNEVIRVVSVSDIDQLEEARQEGRLQERLDFYRNRIGASETDNPLLALEVSGDYSSAVVTTYLKQLGSSDLVDFDDRVHLWARENLGGFALRSGGPALMFAHLGEQNIRSMLAALVVATLVAALILGAALRSWRTALIGLACNILPILLVYSVWAVVYGNISIGAAIVMGMVLGIVLDDTIYLLTAYRRGVRRELANPVSSALRTVGPALIATSVALCAGLSLGLLSEFGPVWSMSVLSIAIIATALVVDLVLLPALLPASRSRREQV